LQLAYLITGSEKPIRKLKAVRAAAITKLSKIKSDWRELNPQPGDERLRKPPEDCRLHSQPQFQ